MLWSSSWIRSLTSMLWVLRARTTASHQARDRCPLRRWSRQFVGRASPIGPLTRTRAASPASTGACACASAAVPPAIAAGWSDTAARDRTTHFVFDPMTFLKRLAALVPPPRAHLVVDHGVLASAPASFAMTLVSSWLLVSRLVAFQEILWELPGDPGFGIGLASGLDADRDGTADFLIGSPGEQNVGSVFLYSGRTGQPLRIHHGTQPKDALGGELAVISDLFYARAKIWLCSTMRSLLGGPTQSSDQPLTLSSELLEQWSVDGSSFHRVHSASKESSR